MFMRVAACFVTFDQLAHRLHIYTPKTLEVSV